MQDRKTYSDQLITLPSDQPEAPQPSKTGFFNPVAVASQPRLVTKFKNDKSEANLNHIYNEIKSAPIIREKICLSKNINPNLMYNAQILYCALYEKGIDNEVALRALLAEFHLTGLITLYLDEKRTEELYQIADSLDDLFDQLGDDIIENLEGRLHYPTRSTGLFLIRALMLEGILSPDETEESLLKKLLPVDQISYAAMNPGQ